MGSDGSISQMFLFCHGALCMVLLSEVPKHCIFFWRLLPKPHPDVTAGLSQIVSSDGQVLLGLSTLKKSSWWLNWSILLLIRTSVLICCSFVISVSVWECDALKYPSFFPILFFSFGIQHTFFCEHTTSELK